MEYIFKYEQDLENLKKKNPLYEDISEREMSKDSFTI